MSGVVLETFVVAASSDACGAYFLAPRQGVIAYSRGDTFSTAQSLNAQRLSKEAIDYVRLGLGADLRKTPGIAKHVDGATLATPEERVLAGLSLADERFRALEPVSMETIDVSVVALAADAHRARLIVVGLGMQAHRVRGSVLDSLISSGAEVDPRGLGRGLPVRPRLLTLDLERGDVFALGLLDDEQKRALCEDAARRLDRALARCAATNLASRFALILARWG